MRGSGFAALSMAALAFLIMSEAALGDTCTLMTGAHSAADLKSILRARTCCYQPNAEPLVSVNRLACHRLLYRTCPAILWLLRRWNASLNRPAARAPLPRRL